MPGALRHCPLGLLSIKTSASGCKNSQSANEWIQSKERGRLGQALVERPVQIYTDLLPRDRPPRKASKGPLGTALCFVFFLTHPPPPHTPHPVERNSNSSQQETPKSRGLFFFWPAVRLLVWVSCAMRPLFSLPTQPATFPIWPRTDRDCAFSIKQKRPHSRCSREVGCFRVRARRPGRGDLGTLTIWSSRI